MRVTDSDGLSDAKTFMVAVNEVNQAPELEPIDDQAIEVGQTLDLTVSASDGDLPANGLSYDLVPGAPEGMTIGSDSGQLTWTPTDDQVGDHLVTVRVTDDGFSPACRYTVFHHYGQWRG